MLEAKWAYFFTFIGIQWVYEPFELSEWIPDYGLTFPDGSTALAECKPALSPSHLAPAQTKAESSSWAGLVLLLGADPRVVLHATLTGAPVQHPWTPIYLDTVGLSPVKPTNPFLTSAWTEAQNKVQWKGTKRTRRKR